MKFSNHYVGDLNCSFYRTDKTLSTTTTTNIVMENENHKTVESEAEKKQPRIILIPRTLRLFHNRIVASFVNDPKNHDGIKNLFNLSFWATDSSKELFIAISTNSKPIFKYVNWKNKMGDY